MILPDDVKCKICGKVFCCTKCRLNHQEKIHKLFHSNIDDDDDNKQNDNRKGKFNCAICYNQPFILYPKMPDNVLIHIAEKHLPLYCKKCCKFYNSIEDLVIFSKCTNEIKHECNLFESKILKNDNNNFLAPIKKTTATTTIKEIEMGGIKSLTENNNYCTSIGIQTSPCLNMMIDIKTPNYSQNNNDNNNMNINTNNNDINPIIPNLQLNDFTPPITVINSNSKLKSNRDKGNLESASISSIRNFSSIHQSSNSLSSSALSIGKCISIETKIGKVQTTTSTPMPTQLKKINEKVFDASSCHVSSIHGIHCCSTASTESDNNSSPIITENNVQTPPSTLTSPVEPNKNKTVSTTNQNVRYRPKLHISTTPLRQVMSKSIQKAIVEHGIMRGAYPKKIFDQKVSTYTNSPLDLRTTPTLRRTHSEVIQSNSAYKEFLSTAKNRENNNYINYINSNNDANNEICFTSKKLTTEYLISSSSSTSKMVSSCYEKSNTFYKTCQSIEVVTTTTGIQNLDDCHQSNNEQNLLIQTNNTNDINNENNMKHSMYSLVTPKISGLSVPLKKTISFETPNLNCDSSSDVSDEMFYTPQKSPPSKISSNNVIDNNDDDINYLKQNDIDLAIKRNEKININNNLEKNEKLNNNNRYNAGGLWSLITSVIRFKSFGGNNSKNYNSTDNKYSEKSSLIERCASFAGVLSKPKTTTNDDYAINQTHKRKRTISSSTTTNGSQSKIKSSSSSSKLTSSQYSQYPHYSQYYNNSTTMSQDSNSPPKRIRRIQGRKPIPRMRNYVP